MNENIQFILNHRAVQATVETNRMLLWILRNQFGLTGVKYGCGEGFCGSCTVLIDDEAVRSCQFPVIEAKNKRILTIEGLSSNGILHPIQQAFIQHNAIQCGYCTPGMILNAYALLKKNPRPTVKEITLAMEDNLCRCSTYNRIIEAIQTAAHMMKGGRL